MEKLFNNFFYNIASELVSKLTLDTGNYANICHDFYQDQDIEEK